MRFLSTLLGKLGDSAAAGSLEDPNHSHYLERVERTLRDLPAERAQLLAAFALLLGRVAQSDDQFSDQEMLRLSEILAADMKLPREQALAVAELAGERELCMSADHHIVLRRVRELAPREERFNLVRSLFHLASVDDISEAESEEVRRIATALELTHGDYVALRSEFREFLSLLKGLPG